MTPWLRAGRFYSRGLGLGLTRLNELRGLLAAQKHGGDLATELELQHPDLSVADAEKIAREAVAERSGTSSEAH
jgi:hypothetical protein